jgi:hypothetical protein
MAQLHDRMPLIIDTADYDRWLSADGPPLDLLRPYPAEGMRAYEISTKINKPGYDAPDILDPVPSVADAGGPATPQLPLWMPRQPGAVAVATLPDFIAPELATPAPRHEFARVSLRNIAGKRTPNQTTTVRYSPSNVVPRGECARMFLRSGD